MFLFDRFKDTVFLKEDSELEKKYNALLELKKNYPDNKELLEELYIVKKGLDGENEIKYQLSKSNLGLYVLHDINFEYEDQKAQVDYIVISKIGCYFIECKNLIGNITIDENGNFIREYTFDGKKIRKGMESPLRQVEAQRDVFKKIWNNKLSSNKVINFIKRTLSEDNFTTTHKVLVVAANNETILNMRYAPKYIKDNVIKADGLVRRLQDDLNKVSKDLWDTKNGMKEWAEGLLNLNVEKAIDYYGYYKQKYISADIKNIEKIKEKLIEFRKERTKEMGVPAYFAFNNEELDNLLKYLPKTVEELKNLNILEPIKVKTHGEKIIEIINSTH